MGGSRGFEIKNSRVKMRRLYFGVSPFPTAFLVVCLLVFHWISFSGERLVQYASESLVTEVLVHPQVNTLQQCVRNLLSSFTRHRHILHAGYTFAGTGSWILQVRLPRYHIITFYRSFVLRPPQDSTLLGNGLLHVSL